MKRHSVKGLYKYPGGVWFLGGSLNEVDPPGEAPLGDIIKGKNWRVDRDGKSKIKRLGCEKYETTYNFLGEAVRGIFDFRDENNVQHIIVVTEKKIWVYNTGTPAWTQVYSQATALTRPVKLVAFESGRPIIVGFDKNLTIEPTAAYQLGMDPPSTACVAAESTWGANLVINGGFDSDTVGWSAVDCTLASIAGGQAGNCLEITRTGADYQIAMQSITVIPGKTYKLEGYVKSGTSGNENYKFGIQDTTHSTWIHNVTDGQSSGDWVKHSYQFTAPAGCVLITIQLVKESATAGTMLFDEITLQESAGSNLNGKYSYFVTFYRSGNYPCESNPSPESNSITVVNGTIALSDIPISSDPKCNARRIYRCKDGGAIFYWTADISDNTTTTYQDNIHDDSLTTEISYDRGVPTVGDDVEVWDNRLWIIVASENRVYFTNTGTAEEMKSSNQIPLKAQAPDNLQGLKAYGGSLYLFKRKNWFRIDAVGIASYAVSQMKERTGTDAPASVAVAEDVMIWKSLHGIEVFNGYQLYRPILSEKVERTLASVNKSKVEFSFGEINEKYGEYFLSIPTGSSTEPNKVIVFNYRKPTFDIFEYAKNITALYNTRDGSQNLILTAGTSDGKFYTLDKGYTDDGSTICSDFMLAWMPISGREIWNILRRIFVKYILNENANLTMKVYSNFKSTPELTVNLPGTTLVGDVEIRNEIVRRVNAAVRGTHISFEFINNETLTTELRVIGFDMYFKKRIWKKDITGE